jgi:hypothetical protein
MCTGCLGLIFGNFTAAGRIQFTNKINNILDHVGKFRLLLYGTDMQFQTWIHILIL